VLYRLVVQLHEERTADDSGYCDYAQRYVQVVRGPGHQVNQVNKVIR